MKLILTSIAFLVNLFAIYSQNRIPVIAAYQLIKREGSSKTSTEIQALFKKNALGWQTATYDKKMNFHLVYKGKTGKSIQGLRIMDKNSYRPTGENYYKPVPALTLTSNSFSTPFKQADAGIIRMSFVSNLPVVKQNQSLKRFTASNALMAKMLPEFKSWLAGVYANMKCEPLADTIINQILSGTELRIDQENSFAFENGNKLLTVIFPIPFEFKSYYPFSNYCFREDNGYPGFRILCFVSKNDEEIKFLQDELNYIDHGDFDGDSKDEFLFWYGIHNHEGYVLYYNDFKSAVHNIWSYH